MEGKNPSQGARLTQSPVSSKTWILLLLFATAIWGSTFALVKDTLNVFPAWALMSIRFLFATLILSAYFMATRRWPSNDEWKYGAFLGFFLFVGYAAQTWGLAYTSATNSAFITSMFILMVPFLSIIVLHRAPQRKIWAAVAIGCGGLFLLTGASLTFNIGDVATFICAIGYAIQITYNAACLKKADPLNLAYVQIAAVALYSVLAAAALGEIPVQSYTPGALGSILFLAVFATIIAHAIQISAQKAIEPSKIALLLITEPIFAALFAFLFFSEAFPPGKIAGAALVLLAMFIAEHDGIRI